MMANSTYRVIISDKAYRGILAETFENIGTETGGIFLGKYERGVWYIIENLDPGPNSIFEPAYFEYDTPYVNHLANKIARFYKTGLELIGLWHRHPGSFSSFSATDDSTNIKYANSHDYGAISALVNLDPDFRLTVYHVSSPLRYDQVGFLVGNNNMPASFFEVKSFEDFRPSKRHAFEHRDITASPMRRQVSTQSHTIAKTSLFSWLVRRGTSSSTTDERRPRKGMPSSVVSSRAEGNAVIDMVETELDYLESQMDYDFKMKMISDNELLISMVYKRSMKAYPKALSFIFGINGQTKYVIANRRTYQYAPSFIRTYLGEIIDAE